ncbi:MAG TPA: FecR domain-containing protein [Puia sp.]|jgi:ferric-dicitrate binding protein FerR (iron transport regulator)
MGNIEYNSLEDLVFSRSFRNWVLQLDSSEAGFWDSWAERHPEKTALIQHAKAIIYALQPNWQQLTEEEMDIAVRRILQRIEAAPEESHGRRGLGRRYRWLAAACILGAAVFLGYRLFYGGGGKDVLKTYLTEHKNAAVQAPDSMQTVLLPDGSLVRVEKGSHLYYDKDMHSRREVFLTGEAFFDIRKDAARPFYVYTSQVITKVLGTSFRIKAFPSEGKTIVAVATGKVSVYRKEDFYKGKRGNEPGGIVVTPNQEMVYDREKDRLNKKLMDEPRRIIEMSDSSFSFESTPIAQVFKRLQDIYGIAILYDEETAASCSLTASLDTGSFYEKLNVICKAINATYEVIDGDIVITARGCK